MSIPNKFTLVKKGLKFVNSDYVLDLVDYSDLIHPFVHRLNSLLLNWIRDTNVTPDEMNELLIELFKLNPNIRKYMNLLTDIDGILFSTILSQALGFINNSAKRKKVELLYGYLISAPDYPDTFE